MLGYDDAGQFWKHRAGNFGEPKRTPRKLWQRRLCRLLKIYTGTFRVRPK